jgi:hypothetical protein
MFKVLDWFRSHPLLIGPALLLTSIAAVLYLAIDPITVLFVAVILLQPGSPRWLIQRHTLVSRQPDHTSVERSRKSAPGRLC